MLDNEKVIQDDDFLEEHGKLIKASVDENDDIDIDAEYKDLVDDDLLDADLVWGESSDVDQEIPEISLDEVDNLDIGNIISEDLNLDDINIGEDVKIDLKDLDFNIDDDNSQLDESESKRAKDIFEYVLSELKLYDSMKYAEDLQRYVITKKKYEETTDREIEYLNSLSTSVYTESDRNDVSRWIRFIKNKDEFTISELLYEIQTNEEIQNRLDSVYSEIYNTEQIGPYETLNENSKNLILRELDEILMEIEIALSNKFQEDKIRMSSKGEFNKPNKSPELHKTVENTKAIYLAENIYEIFNEGLSKSNSRSKFYKITAKRASVLDQSLTSGQIEEKYPEKINMTFSKYNDSIKMFLSVIRDSKVDSFFKQICENKGINYKNTVLKPFYIKSDDKIILLSRQYMYDDFIEHAKNIIEGSNVNTTGDEWYVRVYMDSKSYPDIFSSEYVTETQSFKTYTNEELMYYIENIKSEVGAKNLLTIVSNKAESKGLQKINTACRIILAETLVKYTKYHKENFKEMISAQKAFDNYKQYILFEYLIKSINMVKYRIDTFAMDMDHINALDLITIFNPTTGILAKLGLKDLSINNIYKSLSNKEVVGDLSLSELYIIPGIDNVKQSDLKSNKNSVPVFVKSYDNAVMLLKTFINNYNPDNILSLLNGSNNIIGSDNKDKDGDSIMVKGENIIKAHRDIVEHILKDIFKENGVVDEDEYISKLADLYISNINPGKKSNNYDANLYIRTGENNINSTEDTETLKRALYELNINDLKSGISYNDLDWIKRITNSEEYPEFNRIYNLTEESINLIYSNEELLEDLNRLRLFSSDINSVNIIIDHVFKNLNKEMVENYVSGELVKRSGIPSTIPVINRETVEIFVENYYKNKYGIETIYDGINNCKEFTIKRDISFFMSLIEYDIFKIYNKEKPKRFRKVLENLLIAALTPDNTNIAEDLKKYNSFGYEIDKMVENAMIKLEMVCPSNIDYNIIKSKLKQTLYYQRTGFIEEDIKSRLQGYKYYVDDENYNKVGDYLAASKIIASLSKFIGNGISILYVNDMNKKIDELTSTMEKVDINELSGSSPTGERRRSNALYKAYLVRQDKRILKNVNRDLVDFELLTKEPMADGTGGGEFSRTALIEEYELSEKTLAPEDSKDLDYFYTILAIESFNPEIIEYLPRPVIEYMESPIAIEDRFKNDKIFESTKFKVNLI